MLGGNIQTEAQGQEPYEALQSCRDGTGVREGGNSQQCSVEFQK